VNSEIRKIIGPSGSRVLQMMRRTSNSSKPVRCQLTDGRIADLKPGGGPMEMAKDVFLRQPTIYILAETNRLSRLNVALDEIWLRQA
jgi:hypothetical protein